MDKTDRHRQTGNGIVGPPRRVQSSAPEAASRVSGENQRPREHPKGQGRVDGEGTEVH